MDGVEFWLSAWIKDKKDGSGKFMSLSFKPKEERQQQQRPASAPAKKTLSQQAADDWSDPDSIPF